MNTMNQFESSPKPPQGKKSWVVTAALLTAGIIIGFVIAADLGWLSNGHAVPDSSSVAPPPQPPVVRPVSTAPQPILGGGNQTFVDIAKSVKPAVVNIYATKSGRGEGSGSTPSTTRYFESFSATSFSESSNIPKRRKNAGWDPV